MKVLKIILFVFNILVMLHGLYFGVLGIFGLFKNNKKEKKYDPKLKFKVIIAARNEEVVIANLIDSLKKQDYPKELYDIVVIPNNCTDKTKEISIDSGANVLDINVKTKTKGEVLNFVFDYYKDDNSFDSYVIFDADNILDPKFLKEINNKLLSGYEIVQGFRDSKNLYDNWISGGNSLFYYLQALFIYESRINLKSSINVNGTGYAFKKELIEKINYKPKTLTEDIELTTICAINNIKIGYADKAVFYDEQVDNLMDSVKQRKRWVQGTVEVFKTYKREFFKSLKEKKTMHLKDNLFILTTPYIQVLGIFLLVTTVLLFFNSFLLLFGLIFYIANIIVALYLILYYKKDFKKSLSSILLFGLFNVTWIPICILGVFSKNKNWESIKHTKKTTIKDIINNN